MKKYPTFSLRIDESLLKKLHYVAEYEGRSANKQIEQLIKQKVQMFEQEHGEIKLTEE